MGSPWPAPAPDDQIVRGPNYALRRAVVALVAIALVAGGIAVWISRRGGNDDGASGAAAEWNTVVLQDEHTGKLTLADAGGESGDTFTTDLEGLLDVGLKDRLVLGTAGQPSTDGLGVIDLGSGDVTELRVESDTVTRLDTSAYLLASGGPRDPLSLVDVQAGEVVDLLSFVDNDDPIVSPSNVRIDPDHRYVAFTELGQLETVLVDVEHRSSVSLAGSLADIGSDAVLTITNRGATSLADLYGLDGTRVGTVETDAAAGGMVLDDHSALIVTKAGGLVHADFHDEQVDEIGSLTEQLAGEPAATETSAAGSGSTNGQAELVRQIVPLLDRTRLLVLSRSGMAVIDPDGKVVLSDRADDLVTSPGITTSDRCVLVGGTDAEQTLWDVDGGTRIETFDPGFLTGRSADGCTVTYAEHASDGSQAVARLVGPDVQQRVDGELGAVAPDGSAAIGRDDESAFLIAADSGDRTKVQVDTLLAVFVDH